MMPYAVPLVLPLILLAIPFLLLHVIVHLLVALTKIPRFLHRWFLHRSTILETAYHSPEAYALVTGATSPLGQALTLELARRNVHISTLTPIHH